MPKQEPDQRVRKHIEELVKEEHQLREAKSLAPPDHQRLEAIQVELDQCWDLLRQRRALRVVVQRKFDAICKQIRSVRVGRFSAGLR